MSSTQDLQKQFSHLCSQLETLMTKVDDLTNKVNSVSQNADKNQENTITTLNDLIARIESMRTSIPAPKVTKKAASPSEQTTETIQEASPEKEPQKAAQTLFKTSYAYECMKQVDGPTKTFVNKLTGDDKSLHDLKLESDSNYKDVYNKKLSEIEIETDVNKKNQLEKTFYKFVGATIYSEMGKTQRQEWKNQHYEYAKKVTDEFDEEEPVAKQPRKLTKSKSVGKGQEEEQPEEEQIKIVRKKKPAAVADK